MLCSGTLGEFRSLMKFLARKKTMPPVYISPKGGMTENADAVKDDLNWQIPNPSPGVLSFESLNLQFFTKKWMNNHGQNQQHDKSTNECT